MTQPKQTTKPPVTTDPVQLANLTASFLAGQRDPVTAATITSGLGMTDYPSLVTAALNRLRLDGRVECEKRRPTGKNKNMEWHYWLSALPVSQDAATNAATLAALTAERDDLAHSVRSLTQKLAAATKTPGTDALQAQLDVARQQLATAATDAGKMQTLEVALREWQAATDCTSPLAAAKKLTALNSRITELETQQLSTAVGRAAEIERQWQTATGAASPEAARVYIEHMLRSTTQPTATTDATPIPRKNRPRPVEIIGASAHGDSMLMLQFDRRLNSASAIVPRGQLGAVVMLGTKAAGGAAA